MKLITLKIKLNSGFTLIELIIVVAVISGLATFLTTSYPASLRKARDTHRRNDLKQYQTAVESFSNRNNGLYPGFSTTGIDPSVVNAGASNDLCNDRLGFFANQCPRDPKNGTSVCSSGACRYWYISDGTVNNGAPSATRYSLSARLENPANPTRAYFIACSDGRTYENATAPTSGNICP